MPKHAHDIYRNNESFYKALFDLANDGILIITAGIFTECNQRALDMLGLSREQVIGKLPWEISPIYQPDGTTSKDKGEGYLKRGHAGEHLVFEWEHTTGQGKPVIIEISLALFAKTPEPTLLCHWRDITQRHQMQQALEESEEKYRRIVEDQTDFIVRYLPDGTLTFVNQSYAMYFGKTQEELIGSSFMPLFIPEDRERIEKKIKSLTQDSPVALDEYQAITPDGELRWHRWIDRAFFDENGKATEYQSVGRDIHDQKLAEEAIRTSEEKFSKAFHVTPEAVMITRLSDGTILDANEGFEFNTGYSLDEVIGRTTLDLGLWVNSKHPDSLIERLNQYGTVRDFGIDVRIKSGAIRNCLTSADTIEINGETCLVTITRDITESKKAAEALEYQFVHDSLTGLPNKVWLENKINDLLERNKTKKNKFAVMLMDMNRFKETNNTYGHQVGDQLIKSIGNRLEVISQENQFYLVRVGGDEFAMLFAHINTEDEISNIASIMLKSFEDPFELEGQRLEMSASLGIAIYPKNGDSSDSLLRCADVAMYIAKDEACGYALYQPDKDRHSARRLALMSELRTAINENQLCLHYQPKVDIQRNKLLGFEALVRWQHPIHGLIPPGQFVSFAEMGESIRPLTYWVMENAMLQCAQWRELGINLIMSINLSTRNLLDEGCSSRLVSLLEKHQLDPRQFELEITESAFIKDPHRALTNLQDIHATGVQLSIDDFGTGYSSMSYLKRMAINNLKIDMSFVLNMLNSEQDNVIVKSIINLAHNLGLTVIAEGVENLETLEALRKAGCDYAQGYFISKPIPDDQICKWIKNSIWLN